MRFLKGLIIRFLINLLIYTIIVMFYNALDFYIFITTTILISILHEIIDPAFKE